VVGAPEWIGEVSGSSVSYDLHAKLHAYQQNGVQEYVVWGVEDRAIDWFVLRGKEFRPMPQRGGLFRSKVIPGLWLDAIAMLDGNLAKALKVPALRSVTKPRSPRSLHSFFAFHSSPSATRLSR
jgi:hypothetical protein